MSYIFVDESGDLGFDFKKSKTSHYFVVAFLFVKDKRILDKTVKKIFKGFSAVESRNHHGLLHAHKESPKTRQKFLKIFHEKKAADIISIYLNKKKVYTRLQDEKHVLYNYVTNTLLDRVYTKKLIPTDKKISLIISRRETNKFLNENLSSYIKSQAANKKLNIEIEIKSPSSEKGLQAADMICWSIFKKHEHGEDSYYNLIKQEIIEESPLFP